MKETTLREFIKKGNLEVIREFNKTLKLNSEMGRLGDLINSKINADDFPYEKIQGCKESSDFKAELITSDLLIKLVCMIENGTLIFKE